MKKDAVNFNDKYKWGKEFIKPALDSIKDWGRTELYSTGDSVIDEYLGDSMLGGYGRKGQYEIVTLFGDTGNSKSTFVSSMILEPAKKGVQIGYFALEDDPQDVVRRMYQQCNQDEKVLSDVLDNVFFLPENSGYTLGKMRDVVEQAFKAFDIVVIDPIQFIFEASVEERGETEYNRQRLFMREMNTIMKGTGKTLILVSHTSKGGKMGAQGLDRIIGSSAIAQISTKVIEISRKEGTPYIRLWKTRFTPHRHSGIVVKLDHMRVVYGYDRSDLAEVRRNWRGETSGFGK